MRKWPFPYGFGIFSGRFENDFQGPVENAAGHHFQMFSILTPYGARRR
jgi:hypothetical protein